MPTVMNYGEYRDKCVLVTGALGFIGSNLVIRLAGLGARVQVADSLAPGCGGNGKDLDSLTGAVRIKLADIRVAANANLPSADPVISMLRTAKQACLRGMRAATAFNLVSRSEWRRSRLLILCYHGIAAFGQERWDSSLFVSAELFVKRLQTLIDGGFRVLSLPEGLSRLGQIHCPKKVSF